METVVDLAAQTEPASIATAAVFSGRSKAEIEKITVKKFAILVEVNPYAVKPQTTESGQLWKRAVNLCRQNYVPFVSDGSVTETDPDKASKERDKKAVHSLQELVSNYIKQFKTKYTKYHPTGEEEDSIPEKWSLVYQLMKYKEDPNKRAPEKKPASRVHDEGTAKRDLMREKYRTVFMPKTVEMLGSATGKKSVRSEPVASCEFDPSFEVTKTIVDPALSDSAPSTSASTSTSNEANPQNVTVVDITEDDGRAVKSAKRRKDSKPATDFTKRNPPTG